MPFVLGRTYGYVGITGRLDHVDYPNGQRTNYAYYPNTAPTGTGNEPATIALGGKPATVDGSNAWRGTATVTPGANAIPLVATDASGNATTKTINLVVSGGTARTLSYDLAGKAKPTTGQGRATPTTPSTASRPSRKAST